MTAPLRLAMFDMDGTLIDSHSFIVEAMRRGYRAAGKAPPTDAETLSIVGLSLPEAVRKLSPELPDGEVIRLADLYRQSFVALREETGGEATLPLYPHVRATLDALSGEAELLMGVATGKARRGLDHIYASHDLGRFFVTSQTADLHPSKPHPAMLEQAVRETGVTPVQAVMIGDTEYDIAMGRAAGFATIGVAWGYHPVEQLRDAGADVIATSFDQIPDLIGQVLEAQV
ncbi:MAG: HAD-IA family hydrolase [Pseudomonadota bacterium]